MITDTLKKSKMEHPEKLNKPKRKSLFDLTEEYEALMLDLEEAEGVLDEDLINRLAIHQEDIDDKLSNYRYIIKLFESRIMIEESFIEEHVAKKKRAEKAIENIKERLKIAVELLGEIDIVKGKPSSKHIKYSEGKLTLIKTSPVVVTAETLIPDKYINVKLELNQKTLSKILNTLQESLPEDKLLDIIAPLSGSIKERVVSKTLLKEDLKAGVSIDGAKLDDNAGYIRFFV